MGRLTSLAIVIVASFTPSWVAFMLLPNFINPPIPPAVSEWLASDLNKLHNNIKNAQVINPDGPSQGPHNSNPEMDLERSIAPWTLTIVVKTPPHERDRHRSVAVRSEEECFEGAKAYLEGPIPDGAWGIAAECARSHKSDKTPS